jgi:hypothetical protein
MIERRDVWRLDGGKGRGIEGGELSMEDWKNRNKNSGKFLYRQNPWE